MPEDTAGNADAAGLGGGHELLLTQGQDLTADQAGNAGPAQEAQNQHQVQHSYLRIDAHTVHGRAQDNDQRCGGYAVENIHDTHDQVIHPAAEIAGHAAQDHAQRGGDEHDDKADAQGHAATVHQAGQHIHAVLIRAQPVLTGGEGIIIEHAGGRALFNGPLVLGGIVLQPYLAGLAVLIDVLDVRLILLGGLDDPLLELLGDHRAGHLGLDDIAADIGDFLAVQHDAAVVQRVGLAVGGELRLAVDVGLQGVKSKGKAELLAGDAGVDDVLIGHGQQSVAPGGGVQALALLRDGVSNALIGEGLVLAHVQRHLRL